VSGLKEKGIHEEIPEDHETLKENALQKAEYIHHRHGFDCFADDTGLEIDALSGAPGVYSARYSRIGDPVYPEMDVVEGNIRKVLEQMDGVGDRRARFVTVIALILSGEAHFFEGIVEGTIAAIPSGSGGFGYDPIFVPDGFERSFAEMELVEKNRVSHRARAVAGLSEYLKSNI
jgi:XTP/dITP diphosphohydrolase